MTNPIEQEKTYKRKTVICDNCGKEFVKPLSDINKTKHNYCSMKCMFEKRKSLESFLPPNEIEIQEDYAKIIINSRKHGRMEALIDIDDVDKCKTKRFYLAKCANIFYVVFNLDGKQKRLHQFILNCKGELIDHINGNGLDNRKSNLRICTRSINSFNRHTRKSNTGIIGITFNKAYNTYQTNIKKDGKTHYAPVTRDLETAIKYKKELEIKLFGEERK